MHNFSDIADIVDTDDEVLFTYYMYLFTLYVDLNSKRKMLCRLCHVCVKYESQLIKVLKVSKIVYRWKSHENVCDELGF